MRSLSCNRLRKEAGWDAPGVPTSIPIRNMEYAKRFRAVRFRSSAKAKPQKGGISPNVNDKKITIYDIARELGLSAATVSRALQNSPLIGPETRQRVQTYAREQGYRPNRLARSLTTGRTRTIGLVVGDVTNPFFSDLVAAIQQITEQVGYDLLLGNTREDPAREERTVSLFIEKQVDGIVLASPRARDQQLIDWYQKLPIILINRAADGAVPSVSVDSAMGAEMATAHLLSTGRDHLLYLGGPDVSEANRKREDAFRSTVEQVAGARAVYRHGFATAESARNIVHSLYSSGSDRPNGIVAYDDLMAAGALQALHTLGLRVPEDVAVTGFDDCQIARLISPSLTTVSQPLGTMAQMTVDMLMEGIRGASRPQQVVVEPQLVVRRSAPPGLLQRNNTPR